MEYSDSIPPLVGVAVTVILFVVVTVGAFVAVTLVVVVNIPVCVVVLVIVDAVVGPAFVVVCVTHLVLVLVVVIVVTDGSGVGDAVTAIAALNSSSSKKYSPHLYIPPGGGVLNPFSLMMTPIPSN